MTRFTRRAGLLFLLAGVLTGCGGASTPDPSKTLSADQMKANLPTAKSSKGRPSHR